MQLLPSKKFSSASPREAMATSVSVKEEPGEDTDEEAMLAEINRPKDTSETLLYY